MFVTKTRNVNELMNELQEKKMHLAVVTDEYGGTLGLVTIEDIVEEIVGEIWDESDEIKDDLVETGENTYEVSGDMSVFDFFEALDISVRDFESDYTTVGGWAIEMLEGDPHEGDSFEYKNLFILISEMADMRVMKLSVVLKPVDEEAEEE